MDLLSSPKVVIRGRVSVVVMVTVPLGLYIVSHDVDVSDVVSFILGQNCFSIFVVLYLLFGCFQFVFVSDRHATSTSLRNMLSLISSRVNDSLDSLSPSTFWDRRRNEYDRFSIFRHQMLGSEYCIGLHFFPIEVRMLCARKLVVEKACMLG